MKFKVILGIVLTALLVGVLTLTFNIHGGYVLADGSWSIATVDSTGYVGWDTSIALDGGDNPHISYYDWGNGDLKYAYYEVPPPPVGGVWVPVDKLGLLAPYVALVSTIILGVSISAAIIKYRKK